VPLPQPNQPPYTTGCQTSEVSWHLPLLPMTTRKAQKLEERGEKAGGENGCGEKEIQNGEGSEGKVTLRVR